MVVQLGHYDHYDSSKTTLFSSSPSSLTCDGIRRLDIAGEGPGIVDEADTVGDLRVIDKGTNACCQVDLRTNADEPIEGG